MRLRRPTSSVRLEIFSILAVLLLTGVAFIDTPVSLAEENQNRKVTHLYANHECPVSGEKVNPETFYEYVDKENNVYGRIYTCCPNCIPKVEENAKDLYIKHYRTDPETGEIVPPKLLNNQTCPVSGQPIDKDISIEYNGMIVHFCCTSHLPEFLKAPDKYLENVLPDAEEYEFEAPEEKK